MSQDERIHEKLDRLLVGQTKNGEKIGAVEKRLDHFEDTTEKLWRSENKQNVSLGKLETKAGFIGAISGFVGGIIIVSLKWVFGK